MLKELQALKLNPMANAKSEQAMHSKVTNRQKR
jgi:hypothetical protein